MSRDRSHLSPFGSELDDFAPVAGWRDSAVNMTASDVPGDPIAASTVMRPTGGQRDNSDVRGSFMETASWQGGNGLGNDSSNVDDFIRSHRLSGMLQDIDMSGLSIGSDVHHPHPANVTGSSDHTLDGTTSSLGIIHLDSVHDLSGSLVHVEDPARTPVREDHLDRTLTPDPSGPPPFDARRGSGAGEDVHIPSHPQSAFWPIQDTDDRR
ncbi:Hypp4306 [Branchiostoma lanceolatum]|uniref:Hypp4306 protein n=1 Tax=Branchiostoma lanceolatum TaxID=7740 RepID=A0A8K0A7V5_BRALA|nr:Hypp4306 [Branchiostoma lanceolatum]